MNFYKKNEKVIINICLFSLCFSYSLKASSRIERKGEFDMLDQHIQIVLEQYEAAKKIYKTGDYAKAKLLFKALRKIQHPSSLSPYIHFYYALATYHNKEKEIAEEAFLEIQTQFRDWNKRNEIHYWYAQCRFERGDLVGALESLALIDDKHMTQPILQMKKYFLKQVENYTSLQKLTEKFPNDPIIRDILHKKVAKQAYLTQDFSLLNYFKQQHKVSDYVYDPLKNLVSKHKIAYNVAVFLPFFIEELDYESCTDQFVIELYQGIELAIEKLAKEDILINLFAFDTKKNVAITKELLAQEAMLHMDLIIGPLYPDTIPLVSAFAKKHKINLVNPISDNSTVIYENPFAFLFRPDLESYAQKAVALTLSDIYDHATKEPCIGVFYGMEQKNVLQATLYKDKVEHQLGKPIDLFVQLSSDTIKNFFEQVSNQEEEKEGTLETAQNSKLDFKKLTHIYVPSQDELLISNVISLCLKLGIKPKIIGHEQWIKKEILNINQLNKLPILFLAPNYIDYSRPALHAFRKEFFEKNSTQPNEKSYIGYEMMLFFGRMLGRYGTYFQKEWENVHYNGVIFQGVSYGKYHSNQHIPVLRFSNDRFIVDSSLLHTKTY